MVLKGGPYGNVAVDQMDLLRIIRFGELAGDIE